MLNYTEECDKRAGWIDCFTHFIRSQRRNKKITPNFSFLTPNYLGFTLAEVLITLGIIGVVAAISIPILSKAWTDAQYKSAYKKAYSNISQAFTMAQANGDIGELTGTYSSQGAEANFAAIQKYFRVTKSCTNSVAQGCWNTTGEHWRTENPAAQGFIDNSGMTWKLRALDSEAMLPAILVDTNGFAKPNKYGQDRFPLLFNNSNGGDAWTNISVATIGMPTRISPIRDVLQNTTDPDEQSVCPSYKTISCYYTKWLSE